MLEVNAQYTHTLHISAIMAKTCSVAQGIYYALKNL